MHCGLIFEQPKQHFWDLFFHHELHHSMKFAFFNHVILGPRILNKTCWQPHSFIDPKLCVKNVEKVTVKFMSINHIMLKKSPLGVPIRDTIMYCHLGFVAGVLCGHSDVTTVTQKSSTFLHYLFFINYVTNHSWSFEIIAILYVVKHYDSILIPIVF